MGLKQLKFIHAILPGNKLTIKSVISLTFIILLTHSSFLSVIAQKSNINQLQSTEKLIKQNPEKAFLQIKDLLRIALKKGDLYASAVCYEQIGELFYDQSAYSQALNNYYKADVFYRKGSYRIELARNTNKIGQTYYYNRQYSVALKAFQEALALYKRADNRKGIADSYGFIGQTYEKNADYKKAFHYQKLALKTFESSKDRNGLSKIYENLGSIYEDKLVLDSALKYFTKALTINTRQNNKISQIEVINNLGDVYRKRGQYREALIHTHQAASLAKELKEHYQLSSAYRDLSKTYNLMGRNDSAYFYNEAGRQIFINIYSESNKKQLLLLQTLFETEQKDNAIVQFENDKKVSRIIIFAGIGFTLLLIILAWIVISKQKLKNKTQKELNENKHKVYEASLELMDAEIKNKALKEENLRHELELKAKQLNSHILHLIQKNQLLQSLRTQIAALVKEERRDQKRQMQQLVNQINQDFNHDQHWVEFIQVFELVHHSFFEKLKTNYPDLTDYDLRLLALMKMNLTSKDIALLLAISPDSLRISRYRLKKKLNLPSEENIGTFIHTV